MRRACTAIVFLLSLAVAAPAARAQTVEEARARVDHHLREVDQIIRHFQDAVNADCPASRPGPSGGSTSTARWSG